MKAYIQKSDFHSLASKLEHICEELEDMSNVYHKQLIYDPMFAGNMVTQYQNVLNELLKEHQKMIEYYQSLSDKIREIEKDFSSQEEVLLSRINDL